MTHRLSDRLSKLLAGDDPGPKKRRRRTPPPAAARPPVRSAADAAADKITAPDLPSDSEAAFRRGVAAQRDRLTAGYAFAAAAVTTAASYHGKAEASALRRAFGAALTRADDAVELAAMPFDVRRAAGLPLVPADHLYDGIRAEWLALRKSLPFGTANLIEKDIPIPARPARVFNLLQRGSGYADLVARTAGEMPDVKELAEAAAGPRRGPAAVPVPVRPPAGYMVDRRKIPALESEDLDAAEDAEEAGSGAKYFAARIKAGDFAGVFHGDWRMPGSEDTREKCGGYVRLKGCNHPDHDALGVPCDTAKAVPYYCYRIDCPACWEAAGGRGADRAVSRLDGHIMWRRSDLYPGGPPRVRRPLHCVLSLTDAQAKVASTVKGLKSLNGVIAARLKRVGIEAAVIVFHPFRFKKSSKSATAYYSPHLHVVGTGWVDYGAVAAAFAEDGMIFKMIRPVKTLEHANALLTYLFSHAGVATGADLYRYFGEMGYVKHGVDELRDGQLDVPEGLEQVLRRRTRGKYPMIHPALVGGTMPGAEAPPPIRISARIWDRPDQKRLLSSGRVVTETTWGKECFEADRLPDADITSAADMRRFVDQAGRACARDYPAIPPINSNDMKPENLEDGMVPVARQREAAGLDRRLPPQRVLLLRVRRLERVTAPDGGISYNPTKSRPRFLCIVLKPTHSDLCMICRRPLRLMDVDSHILGPEMTVADLPLEVPVLIPRQILREIDKSGPSLRIYDQKTGEHDHDYGIVTAPPFLHDYPAHVRDRIDDKIKFSKKRAELWHNTGERPKNETVKAALKNDERIQQVFRIKNAQVECGDRRPRLKTPKQAAPASPYAQARRARRPWKGGD